MPLHKIETDTYAAQLQGKSEDVRALFSDLNPPQLQVYESPPIHYRMRAEFKVWHENGRCQLAMFEPGVPKKPFVIDSYDPGSLRINELMPELLDTINRCSSLATKLFQMEFLTSLSGEAVVTLIYHRPLDEEWELEARSIAASLDISIIGRSRKQKLVIGHDFITESLQVGDRLYHYQQVESSFTQPNAKVCEKMLAWAVECCAPLGGDLLELYCGNGNFTLPLASQFDRVLATEISKTSVNSAHYNMELNDVNNISVIRMSSEDFTQARRGVRQFRRLKDIDLGGYSFSTVFVDPPRAGLDEQTVALVREFDNILYISCNPETLRRDLDSICQSHSIERFALFDQFPYTPHIESGVLLRRRS